MNDESTSDPKPTFSQLYDRLKTVELEEDGIRQRLRSVSATRADIYAELYKRAMSNPGRIGRIIGGRPHVLQFMTPNTNYNSFCYVPLELD